MIASFLLQNEVLATLAKPYTMSDGIHNAQGGHMTKATMVEINLDLCTAYGVPRTAEKKLVPKPAPKAAVAPKPAESLGHDRTKTIPKAGYSGKQRTQPERERVRGTMFGVPRRKK